MVPFERAFVTSYRRSIVTFPLSLRVSEILPLLCSSTPLFRTPPLVSPKFPHVYLGVGDVLWATKSEGVAISFQDFQPTSVCGPDPPTLQTDGQTEGRHASQYRALHYYSASRGKNYVAQ